MLYYFDNEKLKGDVDISTAQLTLGVVDALEESGASDFTTEDAVSVDLQGRGDGDKTRMRLVFDSKSACDVFLLGISRVATTLNIKVHQSVLSAYICMLPMMFICIFATPLACLFYLLLSVSYVLISIVSILRISYLCCRGLSPVNA